MRERRTSINKRAYQALEGWSWGVRSVANPERNQAMAYNVYKMIAIHLPLLPGSARVALEQELLAPGQAAQWYSGIAGYALELSYRVQINETGKVVCAEHGTTNHKTTNNILPTTRQARWKIPSLLLALPWTMKP